MSRIPALALAAAGALAAGCSGLPDVCQQTPPNPAELRARCTKAGKPQDCAEAIELCREPKQRPSEFCRMICHEDPLGRPMLDVCTVDTGRCRVEIKLEHLQCGYCSTL